MIYILIAVWLVFQYLRWCEFTHTDILQQIQDSNAGMNFKKLLLITFPLCITIPFIEESVFRCALPTLFGNLWYFKILNAALFGCIHIANYQIIPSWKLTMYQVVMCMCLGYYLISLDSLVYAILIHIFYNIITTITHYMMMYIINPNTFSLDNMLKKYKYGYEVKNNKLRKSSSCGNLKNDVMSFGKWIDIMNLEDTDVNKSIKKFQIIIRNKPY
ncbi:MAG: hypothetical protein Homavirus32_2 [Homavirus sp.]|uniref:CAAX prenyl protease 2/Lysostaphin resistance protein A-like domain-containing protein n=1 Tax=Homavirus sp. TaxID=2487769 RepID=A0A3G5A755_9VIRU|nr:MAG: hypothetical protein Homavirus32_2 [Homavirus sp.]